MTPEVHCTRCGTALFVGGELRVRRVIFTPQGTVAECRKCKTLVPVPVALSSTPR